jgi:hypothetical protein
MRKIALLATIVFSAVIASAQGGFVPSQQRDSSVVGITAGQTARLNVFYPPVPAPLLQVQCSFTASIVDDQGNVLKTQDFKISGGKTVSLSLNVDTELTTGDHRAQIRATTRTPAASSAGGFCTVIPSLDIVDNVTGRTMVHLETTVTYPFAQAFAFRTGAFSQ